MTVTLGALGVLVDDESRKRLEAFLVAPVKRSRLVQGYLLCRDGGRVAARDGDLAGVPALHRAQRRFFPAPAALAKAALLQILNVFSSGCIAFSLFRLSALGAFGTLSTIVGTLVGFLAGIYLPVGAMPKGVQSVMKFIP
jgi:multidrug/hemolysin transport system permease protein